MRLRFVDRSEIRWAALVLAGAALSGCATGRDIDGLSQQISDIQRQTLQLQMQTSSKEEVAGLEQAVSQKIDALLRSEADMQVELQRLFTQIEQLQATLEDTNYRLSQLSQQIAGGQQRPQRPGGDGPGGRGMPAQPPRDDRGGAQDAGEAESFTDPAALYQTAYNDYLRGNYDLAILGFRQYLDEFPETGLAANAVYWIGECHLAKGEHSRAIMEFNTLLDQYPRSDKAAGALLKKGYAYIDAGQQQAGIVQLQSLLQRFPGSSEASLATQRLQAMGVDASAQNR